MSKTVTVTKTETVDCLECGTKVVMVWPASSAAPKLFSCGQCAREKNLVVAVSPARAAAKTAQAESFARAKAQHWAFLHLMAEAFGLKI